MSAHPEIAKLDLPRRVAQHVGRLDVSVDHVVLVPQVLESAKDSVHDVPTHVLWTGEEHG